MTTQEFLDLNFRPSDDGHGGESKGKLEKGVNSKYGRINIFATALDHEKTWQIVVMVTVNSKPDMMLGQRTITERSEYDHYLRLVEQVTNQVELDDAGRS